MAEKETNKENKDSKEKKNSKKSKKLTQAQFEKKVLELAGQGLTCEKIGETLKRQDIHPKIFKKKISEILKENDKYINPDLKNTEEKLRKLTEHYKNNKQDKRAMREKDRVFSQLRKLRKHFKVTIK